MALVRKIIPSADDHAFKAQGQKQGTMQENPFKAQGQEQRTKQENLLQRPTQTEQRNVVSEQGVQGAGVAGGAEKQKKEKRSRYDFASIKANTYVPNINQAFTRLFLQGKWRNFRTLTNFCQGFTRTVCMDVNNPVLCSKIEEDKQGVVLNFLYYFTGLYKGNKLMPSLNITLPVRVPFPLPNCFRNLQITLHGSSAVELYTVPVSDIVIGTGYSDSVYVYNNMRKAVCKAVGVKTVAGTNKNLLRNIAHIRSKYSRTMEIAMDLLSFLYEGRCNKGLSKIFREHYMSFSATNTSVFGRKIAENDSNVQNEGMSLGTLLLHNKFQSLYMPDLYKKTGEEIHEAVSLIKGQGGADTEGLLPPLSVLDKYIYKLLFACMNTCHVYINLEEDVSVVDKQVEQLMNFIKVIIMSYYCIPLKITGVQPAVTVEMAKRAEGIYNYKINKHIISDEYGAFKDIGGVVAEDSKVSFPRFVRVLTCRIKQFMDIKEDDEFKSRAETLESILTVLQGGFSRTHSDFENIAKRVYIKVLNCMHLGSDYDARKLPVSDEKLRYLFEELASYLPFMKREKVPTDYGKNCEFYIDRQFKIIFYTMVSTLYLYLIKYALKNNAVGGGFLKDKFKGLFDIKEEVLHTCPIITTVCNECGKDLFGVKMAKPFGLLEQCCIVENALGTITKAPYETIVTANALLKLTQEFKDI